jgi:transcriptional regulator with XRE-family HTH domain
MSAARQKLGKSQHWVGIQTGYHDSTVNAIERGRIRPSKNQARRIARVLGCDPAELFPHLAAVTTATAGSKAIRRQAERAKEKTPALAGVRTF